MQKEDSQNIQAVQSMTDSNKKRQRLILPLCLVMAAVVIFSAIFWRQSTYVNSSREHIIEAVRGLYGNGITSTEDTKNLADRQQIYHEISQLYDEVAAWLVVPGTPIDYPLMYAENNTYYQNHNFDRTQDVYGTPFIHTDNAADFSDPYTIVYGHAMNNSTMFGRLADFQSDEMFQSLSDSVLILADGLHRLEPVASFSADDVTSALSETLMRTKTYDEVTLDTLLERAVCCRDVSVESTDRLVALTTLDKAEVGAAILLLKITAWET